MPEKTVYDQTKDNHEQPAKEKTKKSEKQPEPKSVTEFEIKKGLNKYGFIHVPKKAIPSLPFKVGVPLKARIEGEALVIRKAKN
jgi:hypothetical protein